MKLEFLDSLEARRQKVLDYCKLPSLDPWDSEIKHFIDPSRFINDKCDVTWDKITYLKNGKVYMHDKWTNSTYCNFR